MEHNTTCRGYRIRAQVLYRYPSRRRTLYPTALRQLRRSGHTRLKRQQNRRSGSKKASREIFPDRRVTSIIIHKTFVNLSKTQISDFGSSISAFFEDLVLIFVNSVPNPTSTQSAHTLQATVHAWCLASWTLVTEIERSQTTRGDIVACRECEGVYRNTEYYRHELGTVRR